MVKGSGKDRKSMKLFLYAALRILYDGGELDEGDGDLRGMLREYAEEESDVDRVLPQYCTGLRQFSSRVSVPVTKYPGLDDLDDL